DCLAASQRRLCRERRRLRLAAKRILASRFLVRYLRQHFVDGLVELLVAGGSLPPVTDDALGVDQHQRRPTVYVPARRNRPAGAAAVPERAPGDVFLFEDVFQSIAVLVA